jgi:hypothetical protein
MPVCSDRADQLATEEFYHWRWLSIDYLNVRSDINDNI